MEYTDAPVTQPSVDLGDKMACPYCGHLLPKDAQACDQCDWTRSETHTAEGKASDAMAVLLSIVPGLGHIYKGHKLMGALIMFLITPAAIAFAVIAGLASAGWGFLMLIPYWGAVMLHVWGIEDRVVPKEDEGEQY